ncbi:MAG: putative SOS response-associated peptidase YedK [Paraglaciecola sp.]|jgi:putative SOS response-associated peptidase YedK
MCGRYANHVEAMHGWTDILKDWPDEIAPNYNIAPTQMVASFTAQGGMPMRWGLIPPWTTEAGGFSTFNARLDTVAIKPSFKTAWARSRRCLIPALGYYEWREEEGAKQAYLVKRCDDNVLVFGGLYEPGNNAGKPYSCTILTRPATGYLLDLHRVTPVFIQPEQAQDWLTGDVAVAQKIANQPYADDYEYFPVDNQVNKASNNSPQLIKKISIRPRPQQSFGF